MIQLIYSVFLCFWRRWFGGVLSFLPDNRFLQHITGFLGACGVLLYNGYHWLQIVLAGLVLQGLFFARSHGSIYDYGHGQPPDKKRYDQLWYWKYIKKYIPESFLYGFYCDFLMMFVRYTLPALLIGLVLFSVCPCLMGLGVSCVYALCWITYDFGWVKKPTEVAEYIVGFVVGILLR